MRTPECLHGWLPHLPGNRSLRQKMYGSAKVPADSLRKLGYKNSSRNYIIIAKKSLPLDSGGNGLLLGGFLNWQAGTKYTKTSPGGQTDDRWILA